MSDDRQKPATGKPTPEGKGTSRQSRRILWLGLAVVLACALYTVGWYVFAGQIEKRLPALFALTERQGARTECANANVRGYPFRIGIFCDKTSVDFARDNMKLKAGALRSAAQVYNPWHVVSELDGPASLTGDNGLSARADWQLLHASTIFAGDGVDRASLEGKGATLALESADLPVTISGESSRFAAHVRRNAGDLDIAVETDDFSSPLTLDTRHFSLAATVLGAADFLKEGARPDMRGKTVRLHDLSSEFAAGGTVSLSGDLAFGADGLANGDLKIRLGDYQAVAARIGEVQPDLARQITQFAPILLALDIEPDDGPDTVTLPLTIRNGNAAVGLLPLGRIPPVPPVR
ncbi:DUF2125 domain-containing protein [Pseudohoeflea suaedae]|uniref:DUF2125 domain-containing protein n=1 Tax=Pseudohoeflea suaedae TaxID=877384 RepID=A0A4R5PIY8_9HYPH|nr:DUF2125 domain-containing protein [Pseudohoeflea suaedae]TDH34824.1 DUF2125 domain-containing protein [Pseudohoeflea suaedae]